MDSSNKEAALAAAVILLGFGLVAYYLPVIMLAVGSVLRSPPALCQSSLSRRFSCCSGCVGGRNERGSDMRILITGAAGMIGRKLAARLYQDGRLMAAGLPRSICTTSCPPLPCRWRARMSRSIPAIFRKQAPQKR